jgi:hypothetical protein
VIRELEYKLGAAQEVDGRGHLLEQFSQPRAFGLRSLPLEACALRFECREQTLSRGLGLLARSNAHGGARLG